MITLLRIVSRIVLEIFLSRSRVCSRMDFYKLSHCSFSSKKRASSCILASDNIISPLHQYYVVILHVKSSVSVLLRKDLESCDAVRQPWYMNIISLSMDVVKKNILVSLMDNENSRCARIYVVSFQQYVCWWEHFVRRLCLARYKVSFAITWTYQTNNQDISMYRTSKSIVRTFSYFSIITRWLVNFIRKK